MRHFVAREKLAKKARRELDLKQRTTWTLNPVTRCPPAPKAYNRNKTRREARNLTHFEPCSSYMQNRKELFTRVFVP